MRTINLYDIGVFREYNIPRSGSKDWIKIVNSNKEFCVKKEANRLQITDFEDTSKVFFEGSNFFLESICNGEFGGDFNIITKKDGAIKKIIPEGFIKFIVAFNNKIYLVESLNHSWVSIGIIYELLFDIDKDLLEYRKVLDIEEAPLACYIDNDIWYMVSDTNIVQIAVENDRLEKNILFGNLPFSGFYPNSLVIFDGEFYIGMRGGFGKVSVVNDTITFFKYS